MSGNGDRQNSNGNWLNLRISVRNNHPELLEGLDRWLELNLISEAQVKQICQQNLSCTLPTIKKPQAIINSQQIRPQVPISTIASIPKKPTVIQQLWQGFLDELSIRWLLFLGIFLVIVSSGVLAASQWDNFPILGQYLILLIYTLGFWGIGFWSRQQDNLQLTAQTLNAIAILLVPINFWAINRFSLGNNIGEWLTIIVAIIVLTATIYLQPQFKQSHRNKFLLFLWLSLSYVHLGWHFSLVPKIAIYGGIIGFIWLHYKVFLPQNKYPSFNLVFLLIPWGLLLIRELSIGNSDLVSNYTLAIAVFGWFLATIDLTIERKKQRIKSQGESRRVKPKTNNFPRVFLLVSSFFIFWYTWSISLIEAFWDNRLFFLDYQRINIVVIHLIINLLLLQLFSQSLTLHWKKSDLTAIFLNGLYTLYFAKELIPLSWRSEALNLATTVSKTSYFPESVLGVTLFPYIILFIFIATWLYRRQQAKLASHAERLTFILGIGLTCLSYANPTWRSLNLLLSTITLGYVTCIRQPLRIPLIYITHLLGLLTIASSIWAIFPNLNPLFWGSILVLLMAGEWGIYLRYIKQSKVKAKFNFINHLKQSCWYFGLLLSAISYACFLSEIIAVSDRLFWGLIWLITPGMLTLIAKYQRKIEQRRLVTWLSCLTLITAQLLVIEQPVARFISLSFAIALMLVNAFQLRRLSITVIHIGFGLSLIISLLYSYIHDWNWLMIGAIITIGLYQFRNYLQYTLNTPQLDYISQRIGYGILGVGTEPHNKKLITKYQEASNYWALTIILLEIALLSSIYLNGDRFNAYIQYTLTAILMLGTIIWRYRTQPNNSVLYGVAWLIELLAMGVIRFLGGNNLTLAITNIILGLLALGLVPKITNSASPWATLKLNYIPLIYAALAILWRFSYFSTSTGLITLGAAFILLNTQQTDRQLNRITNYFGFAAISIGIYEIVIYRMQQSSGGSAADGFTILALIAAAIAFCYRLSAWWYRQRNRTRIFNLELPQVILVAHIHWAISSILKIIAASIAIESVTPRLTPISIATSFCLGAYAIIQGKDKPSQIETSPNANDWWVYVGLVEIVATLAYSRLIITKLSFFDPWRVIITCIIALAIYQIPWQTFGWKATPWQRTAVIIPALMALVTAESISYLSLLATTLFYLRIAYYQKNIRWSYLSLGFLNWGIVRLVWQHNTEFIWLAAIISFSILYIAQFDPYLKAHRKQRHYIRLMGSSFLCVVALFYQDTGIIPSSVSLALILIGLGLKIRAFLFAGTITLLLTVIYQLGILVLTYSFLKWIVGLLAGVCLIVVAAGFERQRNYIKDKLQTYTNTLQNWQ